jgi:NTP pyrophosphatase (non-canonical NTP hydrolase)
MLYSRFSGIVGKEDKMNIKQYSKNADKTINFDMSEEERLLQGVVGMTGESAETMDIIKKIHFQKHKLTKEKRNHLIEEIGDVMWYANLLIKTLNTTWEEVLEVNNTKLAKRYPKGHFDTNDSINRTV